MEQTLSDGLDGVDDYSQIASRAGEGTQSTTQININTVFIVINAGEEASIRIAPEKTREWALIRVVFQVVI